jgi:asparagine synthase (glutamine-hydrolysing)
MASTLSQDRSEVVLRNPHWPWTSGAQGPVQAWVRGEAFRGRERLRAEDLVRVLCGEPPGGSDAVRRRLAALVAGLNGSFALAVRGAGWLFAATDRLRSIPLFHAQGPAGLRLGDDPFALVAPDGPPRRDDVALSEFLLTGYVTGRETLDPRVRQLQAAETLWLSEADPEPRSERYFRLFREAPLAASQDDLAEALDAALLAVFGRLVASLDGRRVVLPLSGGFDSRIIAVMLRRLGYDAVLCYTYGPSRSREVQIGREVARRLGLPWHHGLWTRARWRRWFRLPERVAYSRYAGALTSNAFMADWPVVGELRRAGLLADADVVVPGHTGDVLGGSHLPRSFHDPTRIGVADVVEAVLTRHYSLWRWRPGSEALEKLLRERVEDRLELHALRDGQDPTSGTEKWDWQERQAKWIVNSVRAYEFWGLDWRIPFWDHELMDFFMRVPLALRIGKKLYDHYAERVLFPRFGVSGLDRRSALRIGAGNRLDLPRSLLDPRFGRHGLPDFHRAWGLRRARFGHGSRLRNVFNNPNALGSVATLDAFAPGGPAR